jgi:hypothetical protein
LGAPPSRRLKKLGVKSAGKMPTRPEHLARASLDTDALSLHFQRVILTIK